MLSRAAVQNHVASPASCSVYVYWSQYGMEFPIGWFSLAILAVEINPILPEPMTTVLQYTTTVSLAITG